MRFLLERSNRPRCERAGAHHPMWAHHLRHVQQKSIPKVSAPWWRPHAIRGSLCSRVHSSIACPYDSRGACPYGAAFFPAGTREKELSCKGCEEEGLSATTFRQNDLVPTFGPDPAVLSSGPDPAVRRELQVRRRVLNVYTKPASFFKDGEGGESASLQVSLISSRSRRH